MWGTAAAVYQWQTPKEDAFPFDETAPGDPPWFSAQGMELDPQTQPRCRRARFDVPWLLAVPRFGLCTSDALHWGAAFSCPKQPGTFGNNAARHWCLGVPPAVGGSKSPAMVKFGLVYSDLNWIFH